MSTHPSLAIFATVNNVSSSLKTWIEYHTGRVDRILLFIEDESKKHEFEGLGDHVILFVGSQVEPESNGLRRRTLRRQANANIAIQYCLLENITWVMNVDEDELLFENGAVDWRFWDDAAQVWFRNLEVLQSPRAITDIFRETPAIFKMGQVYLEQSGYPFLDYSNGKCAVKVRPGVAASWHQHSFESVQGNTVALQQPMILHYTTVNYDRWVAEYTELGGFSNFWLDDERMPIEGGDRLRTHTRDLIAEAKRSKNWGQPYAFFYSIFPNRRDKIIDFMQRGLLRRFAPLV